MGMGIGIRIGYRTRRELNTGFKVNIILLDRISG